MTPRSKTVFEVAKLADVSIATVSRALNNPGSVRGELRLRVIEAANKLGYTINPAAKALRERRSKIAAIVVPTLDDEAFSRMVSGLQAVLLGHGYAAFVQAVGFDTTKIYPTVRSLFDRGAEAMAIVGRVYDRKLLERVKQRRIPAVSIYSRLHDGEIPSIGIDNEKATGRLVDLLLSLGHRRLAMIAGMTQGNDRQQSRVSCFRRRMRELDGEDPIVHEIERRYTFDDGAAAIRELHAGHPEVTAVICTSHVIALGVLSECRKLGIAVPGHLSVTGFDDFSFATLLNPPLTTLAVPANEIGRLAGEALVGKLDQEREIVSLELDAKLVARESTAPPRSTAVDTASRKRLQD